MDDRIRTARKNLGSDTARRTNNFRDRRNADEFGEAKDVENTMLLAVSHIRPG
jgi:hypothetical protein